jgi:uncharacterized protein
MALDRRSTLTLLATAVAAGAFRAEAAGRHAMEQEPWSVGGLAGTFARPKSAGPRGPAVLIVAGSGPTDRNGNQPNFPTNTYAMLADGLAAFGIRSFRYDKRGIGESRALAPREDDIVFDQFVRDAVDIAQALGRRPDVSGVLILGHSEGGVIGIEAASRLSLGGLVLVATPGRSLAAVLRTQLSSIPMPEELRAEALRMLSVIENGGRIASVPPLLMKLFRPSVQPFLASLLKIDPAADLAKLAIPVLLVQGGRDLQITREDFDALMKAHPDAQTLLLPTANHALKPSPADRAGNIKAYTDSSLALDPVLVPTIAAFVQSVSAR